MAHGCGGGVIGGIFPYNNPSWSLFFELVVNVFYFIYLKCFGKKFYIRYFMVLCLVYVFATIYFKTFNQGHSTDGFIFGFPRVVIGFFTGVALYSCKDLMSETYVMQRQWLFKSLAGLLSVLVFIFMMRGGGMSAFLNSITLVPPLVFVSSKVRFGANGGRICKVLGGMSYPLYILHMPLYRISFILFDAAQNRSVMVNLGTVVVCVVVSYFLIEVDAKWRLSLTNIFLKKGG